jgi:hypothetical protein
MCDVDTVIQYGAEMMESSVKSISRPVIDRLPVTSLDEFACQQLDRVRSILLYTSFLSLLCFCLSAFPWSVKLSLIL